MTKRFLPGTLNPLYEGDSPYDLDLEEFNNPYYVAELRKKIFASKLDQNLFKGMDSPKAVILGPAKFSFNNAATDYAFPVGAGTKPTKGNFHTWYHFRIPELHAHLEDPCSPRLLKPENKTEAYRAINDHPIAPYVPIIPNIIPTQISAGTVVEIQYDRGPDAGMGLFPRIVKVVGPAYGIMNVEGCESLLTNFAEQAGGYEEIGSTLDSDQDDGAGSGASGSGQRFQERQDLVAFTPGAEASPPCKDKRFCKNSNCPPYAASPAQPPDRFAELTPGAGNYRGATISSKEQLQLLYNTFGIRNVISLAFDAANPKCKNSGRYKKYPVEDSSLGCSGQNNGNPCEKSWTESFPGMTWMQVGMNSGKAPNTAQWTQIQNLLRAGNSYIHCTHGVDRTGAVAAKWKRINGLGGTEDELFRYTTSFGGAWKRTDSDDAQKAADAKANKGGLNWRLWKWVMSD